MIICSFLCSLESEACFSKEAATSDELQNTVLEYPKAIFNSPRPESAYENMVTDEVFPGKVVEKIPNQSLNNGTSVLGQDVKAKENPYPVQVEDQQSATEDYKSKQLIALKLPDARVGQNVENKTTNFPSKRSVPDDVGNSSITVAELWISEIPDAVFDLMIKHGWPEDLVQAIKKSWRSVKSERNDNVHDKPKSLPVDRKCFDGMIKELENKKYLATEDDKQHLVMLFHFLKTRKSRCFHHYHPLVPLRFI